MTPVRHLPSSPKSKSDPPSPVLLKRFGTRLSTLRRKHKLTQDQLANNLGISRPHLSEIESGHKNCSLLMLEILALGFRISLSELLKGL